MTNENTIGFTGALELDLESRLVQTKMQKIKDYLTTLLIGSKQKSLDNKIWD